MVNLNWKMIALYVMGAAAGGSIGAIVAKMYENYRLEKAEEYSETWTKEPGANDWVRTFPPDEEKAVTIPEEDPALIVVEDERPVESSKNGRKKKGEAKTTDYTMYAKGQQNREPIADVAKKLLGQTVEEPAEEEPIDKTVPYIITDEEYATNQGYTKVSLTYYSKDDTLAGPDENIITAPEDMIGDALLHFGQGSQDPDSVYVRDEKTSTDYEVAQVHKTYTSTVMGIPDEKTKAKKGRNKPGAKPNTRKVDKHDDHEDDEE